MNASWQLLALDRSARGEVPSLRVLEPATARHPLLETLAAGGVITHRLSVTGRRYWRERAAVAGACPPTAAGRSAHARLPPGSRGPRVPPGVGHSYGHDRSRLLLEATGKTALRATATHAPTGCFDAVVVVSRPLVDRSFRKGFAARVISCRTPGKKPTATGSRDRAPCIDFTGKTVRHRLGGALGAEKGPDVLVDAVTHLTDLPVFHRIHGAMVGTNTTWGGGVNTRGIRPVHRTSALNWREAPGVEAFNSRC